MKSAFLLLTIVLIIPLKAEEQKPPMTRIEFCNTSPEISADSFGAKPKILYIAGTTYSRCEEQPDPKEGIHALLICSEPNIWMVNLYPGVAEHIVDGGPTYNTHHPILPPDTLKEFSSLEFGKEIKFFHDHKANPVAEQSLDGIQSKASELKLEGYRLVLFVRSDTERPFRLDVFKDDKPYLSVRYLSYQTDLTFNPDLFKPPVGVIITESKQNNAK